MGLSFACAVDTGGTGWCWGNNSDGQLGDGTTVSRSTAVQISGLSNIDRIHVGSAHVCAIQNTGKVFCWGDNTYGQLGDGTTTDSATPVEVTSLSLSATQIEVGDDSSCAKVGSGAFYCWGRNTSQLGIAPIPGANVTTATQITALPTLRRIEMGEYHTCGINTTGSMFCWGENIYGQFGANGNGVAPVGGFSGLTNISDFATGSENTCVIVTGGTVYCAGNDSRGTLGNGDADSNGSDYESGMNQPWLVSGITDAVSISMSHQARSACALLSTTNGVMCWGDNTYGQLGDGTTTNSAIPVTPQTELTSDIVRISVGPRNGCALKSDGTVYCWGDNSHGQLGVGDTNAYTGIQTVTDGSLPLDINGGSATTIDSTPTVMLTPSPVASITPTDITNPIPSNGRLGISDASSCALTALGQVWCWGRQYGPTGFESVSAATQRLGLFSVAGLAAGGNNTCALLANGRVFCWGTDTHGESGCLTACADGVNPGALIPNLYGATAIAVGPVHACVVTTSAPAACWGNNANGQVGDPINTTLTDAYEVTTSASVVAVAVADSATCAVLATGVVNCWGDDTFGALGDGSTTTGGGTTPVTVEKASGTLTNIVSIAASTNSFCALDSSGVLWCWGDNSGGQLANGTTTSSTYAKPVTSLTGIQTVICAVGTPGTAKAGSFCAIGNTNITKCWGDAALGNAGVAVSSTPVTVQDSAMYVSTARSDAHGCAITTAYGIKCWGSNTYGQLGDASTAA
ncbi:MAG: RCC1 domain-containing protein, partial [Roseiflexaceae bacterium]